MVTRDVIQTEVDRWKRRRKATRGSLEDYIRSFLEQEIPPDERLIIRGSEQVDAVDHILTDLDSYGKPASAKT